MNNFTLLTFAFFLIFNLSAWSEEDQEDKTIYGVGTHRRASTKVDDRYNKGLREEYKNTRSEESLKRYLQDKIYLPTYDDMAGGDPNGISLDSWTMHLLSEQSFYSLDTSSNGYISREELDNDQNELNDKCHLMGSLEKYTQDRASIDKSCAHISDYKAKLSKINDKLKPQEYYLIPSRKYNDSKDAEKARQKRENVGTKRHIHFENDTLVVRKMPLGDYAATLLTEMDERDSLMSYGLLFILVLLTGAGTILISKLTA